MRVDFIVVCWWVFVIVWAITALSVKPAKERQGRAGRLLTLAVFSLGGLLLAGKIPGAMLNGRLWALFRWLWFAGCAITLAGLIIAIWARLTLGSNWSAAITYREDHQLITRGPYRYVRHPIYTGLFGMAVGTALVVGTFGGLLGTLVILVGIWWKYQAEEALLARHFPGEYPGYKAKTGALFPNFF
jgi:protein-S-isoprenylcysteine O-methyltransferase Ste14